jgi:hypothetical protein
MFITELKDELIALGNEITELKDKFYYLEAPIDVIEPYAVLSSTGNEHIQDTGNEFEDIAVYSGDEFIGILLSENVEVTISYIPQKEDDIFDRILYSKLNQFNIF